MDSLSIANAASTAKAALLPVAPKTRCRSNTAAPGSVATSTEPACVRVCPTGASYQRADGVVAIKQSDCVGCRYCIIACPFEARFFREDKGIVEKCDFCSQRLERGETPACVETCPSKVRIFGDLNDPKSRISEVLAKRQFRVKKREAGTLPQIYYLG
jgi:Fe-S-cluster-containing dehydrogenase component